MAGKPLSVRLDEDTRERLSSLEEDLGCSQSKAMSRALDQGLAAFGHGKARTETGSFLGDVALELARLFGYGSVALFWATDRFDLAAGLAMAALVLIAIERVAPRLSNVLENIMAGRKEPSGEVDT